MTLLPPELQQPYATDSDRAADRELLVRRADRLEHLRHLAAAPPALWDPVEAAKLPRETNGVAEDPAVRLHRWASLFAEELSEVRALAAERRPLSDAELRAGVYLASRLLATVLDRLANDVDGP